MCTLSWQIDKNQLTIIFNRDDDAAASPDASPEKPPVTEAVVNTSILGPKDPESGGYRIAANEHGLVFCLMEDDNTGATSGLKKSKQDIDGIIRSISTAKDPFELRGMLGALKPRQYKPFQLIVFPGMSTPLQWQWDGRSFREIIAPRPLITTSSFLPSLTGKLRLRTFRNATGNFQHPLPEDRHLALHRSRRPWPPAISIATKRKNSATVSLTRVRVTPESIHMAWQPGDPVTSRQPSHEHSLQRRANALLQRNMVMPDRFEGDTVRIDTLFREKSPSLYRRFPGWVMGLIRFILKEKRLNNYLNKARNLPCCLVATNVLNHLDVRAKVKPGSGPMPEHHKRLVFIANHPTGGLDGLLLLSWLSTYYPDIRIIVNELLWHVPHIRPLIVPVDIYSKGTNSVKTVMKAFEKDSPLLIFPSGHAARRIKGRLTEAPWQNMAVKMALKHNRNMVPLHIDGQSSRLFHNVAWLRRKAKMKLNLELLFLSRAMIHPACRMYGITVGSLLTPGQIQDLGENDHERTAKLQQICENLPASINQGTHP